MKSELTERQKEVLDFILSFVERHGYPPTFREIGDSLGGLSSNAVNDHLLRLEKNGWIRREAKSARAIRVLP